jgi:pimeloyl-ACP methyl ester carboxylesterase
MFVTSADGVDLWCEVIGTGPPLMLIPGRGDSTDTFPRCFVNRLTDAGVSVVRFDPRDTGLSGDGGDSYTMATMADDVVCVMDGCGVEQAHVIALSMGGLILIDLATRALPRLLSATFLSAMSPDPNAGMGPAFFDGIGSDPIEGTLAAMGAPSDSDRAWITDEAAFAFRRAAPRPEAGERHQDAAFRLGWPALEDLDAIDAPTLVVHGSADRTLPTAHAEALAAGVVGARLSIIDGMGHLPTRVEWDHVADLVITQTG